MKRYCISILLIVAVLWTQVASGAVGGSRQPYPDSFYTGEGWTRDSQGNIRAIVPSVIALEREFLGGQRNVSIQSPHQPSPIAPSDVIPIVDAKEVTIERNNQEIRVLDKGTGMWHQIPFKIVGKPVPTLGRLNNHEIANAAIEALNTGKTPSLFEMSVDENGALKIKTISVYEPLIRLTKIPGVSKVLLFAQKLKRETSRLRERSMPLLKQPQEKG